MPEANIPSDRRIQILPPLLSNQIAAGEVVERPASIVKELVENSIDAGARKIDIQVEEGGMLKIIVIDDGRGMVKDDLPLAILPHATSKISTLDELENLQSLGFRGEALASIASVSRFILKTRHETSETAWQISLEGQSGVPEIKPASLIFGTRIEVRDLFFNTPARRKFLKSQMTELSHIEEVVRKLALSHMEIGFRLHHNHKMVIDSPAETPHKRLADLCGKDFVAKTLEIALQKTGLALQGWLVAPKWLKRSAEFQYFYVNGRPVRDKLVIHALREAYRDVLYGEHQPQYILFLEMDARMVDFNVHPAKLEVRFREGRLIHDFIYNEVKKRLSEQTAEFCHDKMTLSEPETKSAPITNNVKPMASYSTDAVLHSPHKAAVHPQHHFAAEQQAMALLYEHPEKKIHEQQKPSRFGRAICQLKGLFILADAPAGLMMIDMHAAHERVIYERMKQKKSAQDWQTQVLLLPHILILSKQERALYQTHCQEIAAMGFMIDEWHDGKIMIREVPVSLVKANLEEFMHDLLREFELVGESCQQERYLDQVLAEIACHCAIQAHQVLSLEAMNQLLRDMEETPNIDYCNHGRPTNKLFTTKEIEQFFKRGR